jgi:hypothetical protein
MSSSISCTYFEPLLFSSAINSSTHLPFYFLGVPGSQKGWMSRHGDDLQADKNGLLVCPESQFGYREVEPGILHCLDLDEEAPLPEILARGEGRIPRNQGPRQMLRLHLAEAEGME